MIDKPIHVTDAEFEEKVLSSNVPVIVDFWAPWCGPCHMIAPVLEKIAEENAGKIIVAKINTDENVEWAMKYGVRGIPTMLFVSNGQIIRTQVGVVPEYVLSGWVDELLSEKSDIKIH
jgi:thioredoxin 1